MELEGFLDFAVYGAAWYAIFLLSAVCHEAAHAWAAKRLGDPTAATAGQVTLDPWPHIRREPLGTVVVPWLTFVLSQSWMMGWASAPYDSQWAERHPRRAGAMAFAGPLANLLLLLFAAALIRAGLWLDWLSVPESLGFSRVVTSPDGTNAATLLLSIAFSLNLILLLFNLLPLPPLDGSAVILLLLPRAWGERWLTTLRETWIGWIGLLFAWYVFADWLGPLHALALGLLYPELDLQPA